VKYDDFLNPLESTSVGSSSIGILKYASKNSLKIRQVGSDSLTFP